MGVAYWMGSGQGFMMHRKATKRRDEQFRAGVGLGPH